MKNQINRFRLELSLIVVMLCGCLVALAQALQEENPTVTNAEMMRHNLNEPTAVNPATHNIQDYERRHETYVKTMSPKEDLANDYNRNTAK